MNDTKNQMTGAVLYRAPFVVPVTTPAISDGGVLVHRGRIVAVDRFRRLRSEACRVVELDGRIIAPALINCHCHLELSYLAALGAESDAPVSDITSWIRTLLAQRAAAVAPEEITRAGREALARQYRRGVALVADIGNQPASREIGRGTLAEILFFQELLGVSALAAEAALAAVDKDTLCSVHAPYSSHPLLIRAIKERSRRAGAVLPIHVAESAEEVEFLRTGGGPFHDFLVERLAQVGVLAQGQALSELLPVPGCGSVEYLQSLNVLDPHTICVHAVHVSANEVELIAQTGAKVCLCPGSNRRLGVGRAPVPLMLEKGILPGLGTDSLASNDCLDLWQEMKTLQSDHPGLAPEQIFRMATRGGAETLGVESRLGALAPGLEARMLAVAYDGVEADIYPFLVNGGRAISVEWLEADHEQ